MTDAKLSLAVLARVAEFLQDLPEADVTDLAEGRARLTVIPAAASAPRVPAARSARTGGSSRAAASSRRTAMPAADMGQAQEALAAMSSRDEGTAYLSPMPLKDLKALAAQLDMRGISGLKKADLVDRIVSQTIGYRLNSSAIRRL
ncbi:MAG TPA: Rho termination factor N-terminal domain-containing protein [Micromonosporaceae bacterium]|nr:Rho termination factor N-terminal domain-containing protein [Micromonosporaceae bacterium]